MVASKTFLNLEPKRQAEIIRVCLEEFSLRDYDTASLSDIIKRLNLAKGSFYRYFENKQTLYMFLLQHCLETRLAHDEQLLRTAAGEDFFDKFNNHFKARLQFEKKFRLHSSFLYNLLRQKTVPELAEVQMMARKKIVSLLLPDLKESLREGLIRKDVDSELMAFIMANVHTMIADFISYKHSVEYGELLLKEKKYQMLESEILKVGTSILELMKHGMNKKS